jgi:hypothetical protein
MVTVNGRPWNQIVAHVSDEETTATIDTSGEAQDESSKSAGRQDGVGRDRAVVGIFGLEPGKEYEIDLKVVANFGGDGEPLQTGKSISSWTSSSRLMRCYRPLSVTANIVTPGIHNVPTGNRSRANSLRNRGTRSRSSSLLQQGNPSEVLNPAEPSRGMIRDMSRDHLDVPVIPIVEGDQADNGNASWGIAPSAEEIKASHIRHSIALAGIERDELAAQLKKSRRESQKVEAGLRSEVEALKRAMEKSTLPDQRSRQKSLALQEQVKQAFAAAEGAEKESENISSGMEGWEQDEIKVQDEWRSMHSARDAAREEKEEILAEDKKAMNELDQKLAGLTARFEKHAAKRDKLAKENEGLRQQLEGIASARREVEKRNDAIRQQRMIVDDYGGPGVARPASGGGGAWDFETNNWSGSRVPSARLPLVSNPNLALLGQASAPILPTSTAGNYPEPFGPSRSRQGSVFNPRNLPASGGGGHGRSSTGPSPSSAAVALATQGIPRGATGGISHLGNPTGFFANQVVSAEGLGGNTNPTSSLASRAIRREPSGGSVSPMMANVTAAPFMPCSPLVPNPSVSSMIQDTNQDHHTSLVPPQLQHRIYLPRGRSSTSPGIVNRALGEERPAVVPATAISSLNPATPAFPPLPSQNQNSSTSPVLSSKSGNALAAGPSLASIVTRAIIPNHSPLLSQSGSGQGTPSRQGSGEKTITLALPLRTSSPALNSRPGSWQAPFEADPHGWSSHPNPNTLSPATEEFPPLSPVQSGMGGNQGRVSPSMNLRAETGPSWARPSGSQGPSRRGSLRGGNAGMLGDGAGR